MFPRIPNSVLIRMYASLFSANNDTDENQNVKEEKKKKDKEEKADEKKKTKEQKEQRKKFKKAKKKVKPPPLVMETESALFGPDPVSPSNLTRVPSISFWWRKGTNASQLEKEIGTDFPHSERFFGLANFGNTCYSNSVLQALYFCKPFREKVLEYKAKNKRPKETLLSCLADLFYTITTQKKKVGSIAPKKFIARLRKEKEDFDNYLQQDAHEFLNFLINRINETILAERQSQTPKVSKAGSADQHDSKNQEPTWVHEIFQGILTSETRCLNCETVSSKDEDFLDLQVDIDQNTSITHCLRCFSNMEMLCGDNKFKCDNCCSYQEAQKRMRVKKLPVILALHLKRFKYVEQYNRHIKVSHRVVFPLELRLFNTSDDAVNPDRLYDLVAVVIHCGSGPNRGHYISIVKSHGFWLLFDDDMVDKIDASAIEEFYGLTSNVQKSSETGYILFYQSKDYST